MDPSGEKLSMEAAIKIMNERSHYEVRRNICVAVLLYFGTRLWRSDRANV
jgi:hypothetical protein